MITYEDALKALADPTRRRILELLRCRASSVQELADQMPVSRPAVSQHLKVLKEALLVDESPQGTRRIYRVHLEGLRALRSYLEGFWEDVLSAFQAEADAIQEENQDEGS